MTTVSMSAVWDRTTEFFSERLGAVAGIAALTLFVPAAIGEVLEPLGTSAGPGLKLGLGLLGLVILVISLLGQLAITALALDPAGGAASAWGRAVRRLGPLILVMLMLLVIAFVLSLPVFAILVATGVDMARLQQPGGVQALTPGAAGLIGLYSLILVPVALWLMARIAILPTAIVVAENLAARALGRSFRLTRGLALKIIGVLLLYGIVMWVATSAVRIAVGSVLRLLLEGDGPVTIASALTAVAAALAGAVFSVIGTAFTAKLYLAARAREAATPA